MTNPRDPHANPFEQVRDLPPAAELIAEPQRWTPELFRRLRFMGGLEIHQQVATKRKLFCRCPAVPMPDTPPAARIYRHMRPTLSEMGTYDGTALMEFKTKKNVIYELIDPVSCTYEMDDTPPFLINEEALAKAVAVARQFNCEVVDEMHVARKQYLDGSIPTGFQRTAIIGLDGWVPYKGRRIRIRQLSIEEDSCREVSDVGHDIVFRTDRLGFPLLEVVTEPDARDPWELAEICALLGDVMRATGMVRRGLGASRQDVNISIGGSTRIENKGVSKVGYIARLTCVEALRHQALLELRDELQARGLTELRPERRLFAAAEVGLPGPVAGALVLPGWNDLLDWRTQPDFSFIDELRGVVRVVACLDRYPYVYHRGDEGAWAVDDEVWPRLRRELQAADADAVVLVQGEEGDVQTALNEIVDRCNLAAREGVPRQTRQALVEERLVLPDGRRLSGVQTDFERVLPGADRMYPDTDHPPQALPRDAVDEIAERLPPPLWRRSGQYRAAGLPADVRRYLLREHDAAELYAELTDACPRVQPMLIAVTLVQTAKHLRREGLLPRLEPWILRRVFAAVDAGELAPDSLAELLAEFGGRLDNPEDPAAAEKLDELLDRFRIVDNAKARRLIEEVAAYTDGPTDPAKRHRYLMGRVRERLNYRFPGRRLAALVEEELAFRKTPARATT